MPAKVRRPSPASRRRCKRQENTAEFDRLLSLCQREPFLYVLRLVIAERTDTLGVVVQRDGPHGLLAIANEVAAKMANSTPSEQVAVIVGVEIGFLTGFASAMLTGENILRQRTNHQTLSVN